MLLVSTPSYSCLIRIYLNDEILVSSSLVGYLCPPIVLYEPLMRLIIDSKQSKSGAGMIVTNT